ncbi:hypothetical protein OAM69_04070 [bacterium]|nr:hypothetical protein [bacterium]
MKTFTPLSFAILLSFIACGTYAAQDIDDRDAWLKDATDLIEAGRIDGLEDKVKTTLGENMHEDVTSLLAPLNEVMADHKAVYIDKIDHQELGQSFDQHVYAVYYGDREFVFYSFTFARLENGWQLYALDYADNLSALNQPVNQ